MNLAWLWLGVAVLAQWGFVAALRASNGLRRPLWAALTFLSQIASTGAVAVSLTYGLTVAIAYGVWTGAGVALAAATGALVFGDRLDRAQWCGLALVILGVVCLQFATTAH